MKFNVYESNGNFIVGNQAGSYGSGIEGGCSNAQSNIYIPSHIDGKFATIIGNHSFRGCSNINSIEIGEGYKETYSYSFCEVPNLKSVVLPSSLRVIGRGSFENNFVLENVAIKGDSKLTEIKNYAFNECNKLKVFIIPRRVMVIDSDAFSQISGEISIFTCSKAIFTDASIFWDTKNVKIYVPFNGPSTFAGKQTIKQNFFCRIPKTLINANKFAYCMNYRLVFIFMNTIAV